MVRSASLIDTVAGAIVLAAVVGTLAGSIRVVLTSAERVTTRATGWSQLAELDTSLLVTASRIRCEDRERPAPIRRLTHGIAVGCVDGDSRRELIVESCSNALCMTTAAGYRRYNELELGSASVFVRPFPHLRVEVLADGARVSLVAPIGLWPAP